MAALTFTSNPSTNANDNLISTQPIGPLAELYRNRYASSTQMYPRDLASTHRSHYIMFQFVKVHASSLEDVVKTAVAPVVAAAGVVAVAGAAGATAAAVTNSVGATVAAAGITAIAAGGGVIYEAAQAINQSDTFQNAKNGTTTGIEIKPQLDVTGDTILLYMPETLEFNYDASYSDLSLGEALGESVLTSGLGGRAVTSAMNDPAAKLALNKAGYVFNPQQQLLFNGIDFRTYQMSFTFTPYSKAEAQAVKNIIQTFRKYAAPTVVTEAAGFFFNPPGMVDVTFKNGGTENTNMHKLKRSVLESVSVNYAPNGWAAMEDGAPMQTTMTLSFKETQLVDSKDIAKGY